MNGMDIPEPSLIGNPYAPMGIGEHIRCTFRALRSAGVRAHIVDIYGTAQPDTAIRNEIVGNIDPRLRDVSIFHINGDQVAHAITQLGKDTLTSTYGIVYPAWELSRYPGAWASQLDRFKEIWAPSRFIQKSLNDVCKRPVYYMPLACGISLDSFLGRRYFGIPESDYTFLFFFDLRSYDMRKNCKAVIEAFRMALAKRPKAQTRLVLKVNSGGEDPSVLQRLHSYIDDLRDQVAVIDMTMTDNEIKNLIRCCDCFVSLHRSEGYGRGMAEAMLLGKPVIATGYSGNMDFMSRDIALLVGYELIRVAEGAYPYWQDQVWADPDIQQAADYMVRLIDDPECGRAIGQYASRHIRVEFGYRAIGLRYRDRLGEISRNQGVQAPPIEAVLR